MLKSLENGVDIVKKAVGYVDDKATIIHQNNVDYTPKVSVIIPVYNVEKYLRRCLNSLQNQTLKDIEVICIDDCSTDNSLKVLKEYAELDNRIIVIESEKNSGAAIARNRGLEIAKGEYLGFIDPDDEIDLNYYEELYNKAVSSDASVVKCVRETINLDGQISRSSLNDKIKKNKFSFTYEWTTAIYKKSLIDKHNIKFPEECIKAQDIVFLNRVLLKLDKIELIDNVKYRYHRRKNSLNADLLPDKYVKSALLAIKIITDEINASNLYDTNKKDYLTYYASKCFAIINNTIFQTNSKKMVNLSVEAFIDIVLKCKDVKALLDIFPYKWMKPYILNKNVSKITNLICPFGTVSKKNLCSKSNSFIENIFSVKNKEKNNKWYKIITFLGIKFKFRSNFLTQKKQLKDLSSLLEMQQSINELIKSRKEGEKQISKLETMINILQEKHVWLYEWQQNFYKDHPEKYPIRLTEAEKQAIKNELSVSKNYLEFGAGGSTFIALQTDVEKIYSVESDIHWINYLQSYKNIDDAIKNNKLNFFYSGIGPTKEWGYPVDDSLKEMFPKYSSEIFEKIDKNSIDLVFIDGRFRVACVLQTIMNCSKHTKIMIHDYTQRQFYHLIEEFLEVVEIVDTLAIFQIKDNIDKQKILDLYEKYKFVKE